LRYEDITKHQLAKAARYNVVSPILFQPYPPPAKNSYKFLRSSLSWYTFPEKSKNCDSLPHFGGELIKHTVLVSCLFFNIDPL
jgi:hypothetical protein